MSSLDRDRLDAVRWSPDGDRDHVESFFLKANDPARPGRALWLKWTVLASRGRTRDALAEVWAIRFDASREGRGHHAAKSTVPAASCVLRRDRLELEIAGAALRPGEVRGRAGEGGAAIEFDLRFDHAGQQAMFGFPHAWMYEAGFPKSKLYTSCPATRFTGFIEHAGERWTVDGWPGMLGHNWGVSHNPRYHWAQCSLFDGGEDFVFEGYSGKIRLGPLLSPWLTGAVVRFEGETLQFNALRRLINSSVRTKRADDWSWAFTARRGGRCGRGDAWKLDWRVSAPTSAFVGLRYLNPDGSVNHCLNSKVATCEVTLSRARGRGYTAAARVRGTQSCAYEILTRDFDHGVPVLA